MPYHKQLCAFIQFDVIFYLLNKRGMKKELQWIKSVT